MAYACTPSRTSVPDAHRVWQVPVVGLTENHSGVSHCQRLPEQRFLPKTTRGTGMPLHKASAISIGCKRVLRLRPSSVLRTTSPSLIISTHVIKYRCWLKHLVLTVEIFGVSRRIAVFPYQNGRLVEVRHWEHFFLLRDTEGGVGETSHCNTQGSYIGPDARPFETNKVSIDQQT